MGEFNLNPNPFYCKISVHIVEEIQVNLELHIKLQKRKLD